MADSSTALSSFTPQNTEKLAAVKGAALLDGAFSVLQNAIR